MRLSVTLLVLSAGVLQLAQASVLPVSPSARRSIERRSSANSGTNGAVVSEAAECSDIGVDILKIGGSAADAVSTCYILLARPILI